MDRKITKKWIIKNHKYLKWPLVWLSIISMVLSLTAIFFAFYSRETIDAVIDNELNKFMVYAIIIGGIMLINLIFLALNQYFKVVYKAKVDLTLKNQLFKKIILAEYDATKDTHSGVYMTHLESDIDHIAEGLIEILPRVIFNVVRFMGGFILLFLIDELFALLLLAFGILMFFSSRVLANIMKRRHHRLQKALERSKSYLQESIENMVVIKAFEAEQKISYLQNENQIEVFDATKHKNNLSILISSGLNLFFAFGYAFAIIFGAWRLQHGLSVGSLLAMIQLVQHVQSPFSGFSMLVPKFYHMIASAERVIEIDSYHMEPKSKTHHIDCFKSLHVRNLEFSYDDKKVINNLTFDLKPGEFIYLKGDSGKGKTTLFKILLGLLLPLKGEASIICNEETKVSAETRAFFSYVPQQNFILSGTIRDNLNLYKTYPDEELVKALEIAALKEDIMNLPMGLDTLLGERGKGLSEGQVQRLAIARAILKDAPILLLDEITSALDQRTESKVMRNLQNMTNKAVLFISHRPVDEKIVSKTIQFD
ncbi:MAG: ABC transporter ATP-binding protein [Acholeplasmataceae bacterium]|jgi:ATP-binding cassette subfamily B protein|nr:ABC transporter ATP-binding protein [Acholeplasmataceae bacterium]